jgi:hypothetical protein
MQPPVVVPGVTTSGLDGLVKLRNFLAHRYLLDRAGYILMPEARDDLIAELRHYTRVFVKAAEGCLLWVEELQKAAGSLNGNIRELAAQVEPNLQALDAFREQLLAMGAIE